MDKKLVFLESKIPELDALKSESDSLHDAISSRRFKVPNADPEFFLNFRNAFILLSKSKKCSCKPIGVKKVLPNSWPVEISLFQFKFHPVVLYIDNFYFCIFQNVILIFDENGYFSSTVKLSSLKINVTTYTERRYYIDNKCYSENLHTALDSKCLKRGSSRQTWLHTCVDGSPDLRYNYNPRIEERSDICEYGVIDIELINKKITFTISSEKAIEAFNQLQEAMKNL